MASRTRWLYPAAALSIVLACHACAGRPAGPPPALAEIVRAYDREAAPYSPFTASEAGLRQYDRVLANDIGTEYRRGLQALCTRYRRT